MNYIYGVISLTEEKLDERLGAENTFIDEVQDGIQVCIEKSNGTQFIQTYETKRTVAIFTGYFDQPIYDEKSVDLKSVVDFYETTGGFPQDKLYGNFQLFFYEKDRKKFTFFCDRGGLRSIFYYKDKNKVYFANKIHLFERFPSVSLQPNQNQRDFSLVFGFYPGNSTVYESVNKLNGDNGLTFDKGIEKFKFNSIKELPKVNLQNEGEIFDRLYHDLTTVIKKQTEGYDRVAVHLGGFDSALVTAILKRIGKDVETYTFSFSDSQFNQTHTDTLSKLLGIKHHWIDITPDVFKEALPEYKKIFDQPTNWANYVVQTVYATKFIKEDGFDICLSGDGCDTLFQGYPGVNRSAKLYNKISPIIKPFSPLLLWLLDSNFLEKKLGHIYRLLLRVIRNSTLDDPERTFLMQRIFDETTIARTFDSTVLEETLESISQNIATISDTIPSTISLNKLAYLGRSNMGPNRTKLSGTMDASSVIVQSPFMHNEIKKVIGLYPDSLLRPNSSGNTMSDIGKYALTQMTKRYNLLPDEIIFQKKQAPVNSPIDEWYRNELSETVEEMLVNSPWKIDKSFVRESLAGKKWPEEFYKESYSADKVVSHGLSLLLTTLSFYEK